MRIFVKVVTPLVALLAVTTAAVAVAAPVDPVTPFPDVPANANVCKVEKLEVEIQQKKYDLATRKYDRAIENLKRDPGSVSNEDLRKLERNLHLATLAFNNAKFAEATCLNDKGNNPKKVCIALVLELNRLKAELSLRVELARLAKTDYDRAVEANTRRPGTISAERLDELRTEAEVAELVRRQVGERIAGQVKKLDATPECKDFPRERPKKDDEEEEEPPTGEPTSPTVTGPASPSTAPTRV